jgi:hypothetical protein
MTKPYEPYEPYKTALTEATDLCWFIRKLADDPKNEKLQKQVQLMSECFLVYVKNLK